MCIFRIEYKEWYQTYVPWWKWSVLVMHLTVKKSLFYDNSDVIMSANAYEITGVSIVYWTFCPGADGLCDGNSPVTGEFPAPRASNAENVSIWWRHHVLPARETTQRVTPAIQATDRYLYHSLIDSVSALDDTFHEIVDVIRSVLEETTEIYHRLKLRVDFHRCTSLDAVEYTVKHDFSR